MRKICFIFILTISLYCQNNDGIIVSSKTIAQLILDMESLKQENLELQKKTDILQAEVELLKKEKINFSKKIETVNHENTWILPIVNKNSSDKEELAKIYKEIEKSIPGLKIMTQELEQREHICSLVNINNENIAKENIVLYEYQGSIDKLFAKLKQDNRIFFGPAIAYPSQNQQQEKTYNIMSISLSKPFDEIDGINYPYLFLCNNKEIDQSLVHFTIGKSGKYYYRILLPKDVEKMQVQLGPFWEYAIVTDNSQRFSIYRLKNLSMPKYLEHLNKIYNEQGEEKLHKALLQIKSFYTKKRLLECSKQELQELQSYISSKSFHNLKIYELASDIDKMIQTYK